MQKSKPVLYLIGDSTVKNGSGKGVDGLWGWGDFLHGHFDTTRMIIDNQARGGHSSRSSRTFLTEGLWDNVLSKLKTAHRFTTPDARSHYRLAIAWQNVAYNQPPHVSFYLGEGMKNPPRYAVKPVKAVTR